MPPKDTQPHSVTVSADGGETFSPLGKVADAHLFVDDLIPEDRTELPFGKLEGELTLTCKFNIRDNPSAFMLLATGKWPSNNWLRMHGYPMVRRCGFHRRNRK